MATDAEAILGVQEFELKSKSGVGVHVFEFTPPSGGGECIYMGSEVTDENNVLNVAYQQWSKVFVKDDGSSSELKSGKWLLEHCHIPFGTHCSAMLFLIINVG